MGDGTTTTRTFNEDGLISQIVTAGVTLGYTFDNANRIGAISDSSNSALTWTYGYDPLDRLTSAKTSATTDGWTYDANGNRLTQTGTKAITFAVSPTSNQLTSTSGGLTRTYTYDAAGNATGFAGIVYGYNDRGRMKATSQHTTNYLYNALGQMIEKPGNSGTTLLMQDEAGHLIGEYSSTGALVQETIWLGDIPVATLRPNGSSVSIYYVHTDHLNAPRKAQQPTTDTLAWRWDADPFGTAAPNQNPGSLGTFVYNLRFPGQYYMAETGLSQNYFRDFDPAVGRYIESDPIGLRGGINTYAYVGNNPVSRTDTTGRDYWVEGARPGEGGLGFHQNICVGKPTGSSRFCISFGEPEQPTCYFHCLGKVYDNTAGGPGPITSLYRITDSSVDAQIASMFAAMVGAVGSYSVIGHNCRDFSQYIFNELVSVYGGGIPADPNAKPSPGIPGR